MSQETTSATQTLRGLLDHFMQLLLQEQEALQKLDYALIDGISKEKLELQAKLDSTMQGAQAELSRLEQGSVDGLKKQLSACRELSKENLMTTKSYQEHVQAVCNKLSGAQQSHYGRTKAKGFYQTSSQAVLTDSVG